jgi:glycerophosphoryl diester phosphodiesterase
VFRPIVVALLALWLPAVAGAFDLQGHRGARGLAPENTLAAFDRALALGVDTLELDTLVTRDDRVVVAHDPTLNPNITRDDGGRFIEPPGAPIRSLTLAELRRFDVGRLRPGTRYAQTFPEQRPADGQRIPTLAEVFALARERRAEVRFNIETKITAQQPELAPDPEAFVRLLLAEIDRAGLRERVSLQSFDWRTLEVAQRLAPAVPTVYLSAQQSWLNNVPAGTDSVPKLVKRAGGAVWSPYFGDLTPALLKQAHDLGLKVIVWTVNADADIERLLDWGVDGIISDRPDRVREALARRGQPLPRRYPGSG